MITLSLRYLFIVITSIYIYFKILNIPFKNKSSIFSDVLFSFVSVVFIHMLKFDFYILKLITILTIFLIYLTLRTHTKLYVSAIVTIFSFAFSFIALSISGVILSSFRTFFPTAAPLTSTPFIAIGGLLQLLCANLLFRIKRLQNGMPFLYKKSALNIGLLFSIFALVVTLIPQHHTVTTFSVRWFILLSITFLSFALLHWWRRKITQSYIEKLRLGELEDLYKDLENKEKEIEKLRKSNQYLDRIIHKDNKLIPAMEFAVNNYLQNTDSMNTEQARQYGQELLSQLQEMSDEREGIINTYKESTSQHLQTGIPAMDAVLQYMEKRALESGIRYSMKFDDDLKQLLPKYISEADALHMLSDLIENALIAASHSTRKEIHIHLGFSYENLFFDIYDSGVPFTVETYQNFGNQRYTTYADSGGSGIGLTDIWKLKRKYKASLQIYEYAPEHGTFTKKIRILFDRKNHFLIQTYRAKEIHSNIIRSDLHVFPYGEYTLSEIIEDPSSN